MKRFSLYRVWLIILVLITTTMAYSAPKGAYSIPFDYVNGLIVIEAEVDGIDGNYILDTGSSDILINDTENKSSSSVFSTPSEDAVSAGEKIIKNLLIGGLHKTNIPAYTVDLSAIEAYVSREISGVLGSIAFAPSIIDIDFASKNISLLTTSVPRHMYEDLYILPFEMENEVPVVSVKMNGTLHTFILDTGATSHFVNMDVIANSTKVEKLDITKQITTSFSNDTEADVVIVKDMEIGDKVLKEISMLSLNLDSLEENMGRKISGLLSVHKLASRVIIDLENQKILF